MAREATGRPFILRWRSAVLNSAEPASVKLTLIALAEYANANGAEGRPSFASLARLTGQSEKTCRRACEAADGRWFTRALVNLRSGYDWRCYEYQLTTPEGADTSTARSRKGADVVTAAKSESCGHSVENVRTFEPKRADTVSDDRGTATRKSNKGKKVTLREWMDTFSEDEDFVPENHRVFSYAREIQLPEEFLELGWEAFRQKYQDNERTKHVDWSRSFLDHVKNPSWLSVWFIDSATGQYRLTTKGLQLQLQLTAQDRRAA